MLKKYFCFQGNDNDCGFAALKMLIANLYGDKNYLFLKKDGIRSHYSFMNLEKIALKHGLKLKSYRYEEDVNYKDFPTMFLTTFMRRDNYHMVYVQKRFGNFLIFDPDVGCYYMRKSVFLRRYSRFTMEIVSFIKEKFFAPDLPRINRRFVAAEIILEIVSSICLLLGFYFMGNSIYPFYLAISLLSGFIIGEIFISNIRMHALKEYDKKYINYFFQDENKNTLERYNKYQTYKTNLFLTPRRFYSSIIIAVFVAFVMLSFSLYFLIMLGLLFLLIAFNAIIKTKVIGKKARAIAVMEKDIFVKHVIKRTGVSLLTLQEEGYKYSLLHQGLKYINIFIILVISILIASLCIEFELSTIFFVFLGGLHFFNNASEVLSYATYKKTLRRELFEVYDEFFA